MLGNVCWQELVGFVLPERKAAGRFCVTMLRLTSASPCVNFSLPNPKSLIIPYSPNLALCDYFLFPKNEIEGKAVRYYLGHSEGFDRGYFISKEDFQRSFLKLYRCKHCISSEEMYFK